MNTEQFAQLLQALEKIATKTYTLTGAADWPLLLVIGGLLVAVLGAMWHDLRTQLSVHKQDNEKDIDTIFEIQRRCQDECCPRRVSGHHD